MVKSIYHTPAWRSVRVKVLERDQHRCQLKLSGCLGAANSVDHTIEVFEDGALYDMGNLRASCGPCNSRKHMLALARRASATVRPW